MTALEQPQDHTPCPACQAPATYVREMGQYVHKDGSDNRQCWTATAHNLDDVQPVNDREATTLTPDMPWAAVNGLASLSPGTVTAVVSASTVGKSTLAYNIALHNADRGVPVGLHTYEVIGDGLLDKLGAAKFGVDIRGIAHRKEEPLGGWGAFKRTARGWNASTLVINNDNRSANLNDQLTRTAAKLRRFGEGAALVVVDSVQAYSEFREGLGVADRMATLRQFAKHWSTAVLVTSQMVQSHASAPTVEDIPGEVRSYAHTVLGLNREGAYDGVDQRDAEVEVLVGENRGKKALLTFEPWYCRFVPKRMS